MKALLVIFALSGSLLLSPSLFAQAAHPGHGEAAARETKAGPHGSDPTPWKWVNFFVLMGGLGYLLYRRAGTFFQSRTGQIQKLIEEATRAKKEAEERVAAAEARLGRMAAEIETLRAQSRKEMAAEQERLRLETEREFRKIQANAEREIASAAKASRQELKAYTAELAVDLAGQKIRARLTDDLDSSLVDDFVAGLDRRSSRVRPGKELN